MKQIHDKVHSLFTYKSDRRNYKLDEHWTSHANAVERDERFTDDCDGFALTCAELLLRSGVHRSKVSIIYCETETGEPHLVCGVNDDNCTYILDNRFYSVYEWRSKRYKWLYYMMLDEMGTWRKIENG